WHLATTSGRPRSRVTGRTDAFPSPATSTSRELGSSSTPGRAPATPIASGYPSTSPLSSSPSLRAKNRSLRKLERLACPWKRCVTRQWASSAPSHATAPRASPALYTTSPSISSSSRARVRDQEPLPFLLDKNTRFGPDLIAATDADRLPYTDSVCREVLALHPVHPHDR
ncbi:hypothetical protein LZ31DRAFT_635090, partial [Colletotrichum somersetense]